MATKPAYSLHQVVYLVANPEVGGMITGILYTPNGIEYYVTWGDLEERCHYEGELTTEKAL